MRTFVFRETALLAFPANCDELLTGNRRDEHFLIKMFLFSQRQTRKYKYLRLISLFLALRVKEYALNKRLKYQLSVAKGIFCQIHYQAVAFSLNNSAANFNETSGPP